MLSWCSTSILHMISVRTARLIHSMRGVCMCVCVCVRMSLIPTCLAVPSQQSPSAECSARRPRDQVWRIIGGWASRDTSFPGEDDNEQDEFMADSIFGTILLQVTHCLSLGERTKKDWYSGIPKRIWALCRADKLADISGHGFVQLSNPQSKQTPSKTGLLYSSKSSFESKSSSWDV